MAHFESHTVLMEKG